MNYEYIENLVLKAKNGDSLSKEKLAQEFRPLIINISKKTFLHGYDNHDIQNECYRTLFRCVFYITVKIIDLLLMPQMELKTTSMI